MAPNAIPELLEQIDELLAEPAPKEEPASLAYLERTLTDGYAYALELESERWRLERRMSELAGELHDGDLLPLAIGHHHGASEGVGRDFDPQPLGHSRCQQGM